MRLTYIDNCHQTRKVIVTVQPVALAHITRGIHGVYKGYTGGNPPVGFLPPHYSSPSTLDIIAL